MSSDSPTMSPREESLGDMSASDVFKMVEDALAKETTLSPEELKSLINALNDVRIDPRTTAEEKKKAVKYMDELEYRFSLYSNKVYADEVKLLEFDEANRAAVDKIDIYGRLNESEIVIHKDHILGQGSFGTVYLGSKDGLPVAIKVLNPDASESDAKAFRNEAQILARMRHPYCCEYIGYLEKPFRIVTRRYPTTLYDVIADDTLSVADRLQIAFQLASAISYLHSIGLLHRDLKSENIFIDENKNVRVADFGLTEYAPGLVKDDGSPPGSLLFMSPEQVLGKAFDCQCEVYTLGMMLHELFSGRLAFEDVQTKQQLIERQKASPMLPVFAKDYSTKRGDGKPPKEIFDLAADCYKYDPNKRPKLEDVMKRIVDISVLYFIPKSGTAARFWKMMCCYSFRKSVLLTELINSMINIEPRYSIAETLKLVGISGSVDISQFWNLCCWFPNFFFNREAYALMEDIVRSTWFVPDERIAGLRLTAAKQNAFVIRPSATDPYHEPFTLCLRVEDKNHYSHIVRHNSARTITFSCKYLGESHFTSLSLIVKYLTTKLSFVVAPVVKGDGLRSFYE